MFVVGMLTGIVGFILILSPFTFGYYGNPFATWASIAVGMMLFINACLHGMRQFGYDEDEQYDGTDQQE